MSATKQMNLCIDSQPKVDAPAFGEDMGALDGADEKRIRLRRAIDAGSRILDDGRRMLGLSETMFDLDAATIDDLCEAALLERMEERGWA